MDAAKDAGQPNPAAETPEAVAAEHQPAPNAPQFTREEDLHAYHQMLLIRRFEEARVAGTASVTNWGTGSPRREFLHVDDMADACLHLLDHHEGPQQVNVGTGTDVTIRELSELVAAAVGYEGEVEWDASKPDGTPQKLLDVSQLARAGWTARIGLGDGLRSTVEWFRQQEGAVRG